VHPNGEGYDLMADVWHPVVAEALAQYTQGGSDNQTSTNRCPWYAAAVRLAESIEGVTGPRAEKIRAELERLGIAAGSDLPPDSCRVASPR
jgi:hypothetical protein